MKIKVNGEEIELEAGMTVLSLIKFLELDPKNVAIEQNLEIVPKSLHETTSLSDGDSIEIVEFVGGG